VTYPARAVRPAPWRALVPEQVGEVTTTLAPVRAGRGVRARPVPPEELPDGPAPWSEAVLAFVAEHHPRLLRLGLHLVVAALPLLAISAHVFGIAPMHLTAGVVVVPLTLVVLMLGLFASVPEDRLVLAGVVWGVLATLVYDAVRLDTVYLLGLWGDFIPTVGTWIVDVDAGSSVVGAVVGYVWRYVGDGGGIGVVFFVLVASTGLRRWGQRATVTAAVVFAVFPVWTGLVATVAIAPRGEQLMFPLTVTTVSLSLLGHLVFGLVLGLGCSRCGRLEEYWPWTPLLDLRRGTRVAGVSMSMSMSMSLSMSGAQAAGPTADDAWGPPALVTARGDDPEITAIRVEPPVRPRPAARGASLDPASGPVRVVDGRSGPLPVSGTPSGPLPVTGPRSGPIPARDPRSGPVPVGPAVRSPGTARRAADPQVPGPAPGPVPVSGVWARRVPPGAADPWLGPGRRRPTSCTKAHPGGPARS
jgi:hypothetical protein